MLATIARFSTSKSIPRLRLFWLGGVDSEYHTKSFLDELHGPQSG